MPTVYIMGVELLAATQGPKMYGEVIKKMEGRKEGWSCKNG